MTGDLLFLPSVRRGLSRAVTTVDPLGGPLIAVPEIEAFVDVGGRRTTRALRLRGPDQVTGLDPAQVLRREPRPDSTDVEPNGFAHVELASPDLPWLFTPAAPEPSTGRLRPWLVLVVVREQEGVSLHQPGDGLPVLTITAPASPAAELPDLAESWGWAHVQSAVPEAEVASAVEQGSRDVVARLVCARRMSAGERWLACVVPAFASARDRGLGGTPSPDDPHEPAWDAGDWPSSIELPVYDHWRFTTGPAGDFESLARRLRPDDRPTEMGLHAMDVSRPGLVEPAPRPVLVDMQGALLTLGASPRTWPARHRDRFRTELAPLVEAAIRQPLVVRRRGRDYDPVADDPVLGPPAWGARAAGVGRLPRGGWVPEVNLSPVARGAAGLGAAVVRANAEDLVAAAWDQAGEITTAMQVVAHGRLAIEVGESWARRVRSLDDGDVLQVTRPVHALLADGGGTVRASLDDSDVPTGTVTAAFVRLARPGTALARDYVRAARDVVTDVTPRLGSTHTATMLAATAPTADDDLRTALDFARPRLPDGAQVDDPTLHLDEATERLAPIADATEAALATVRRTVRSRTRRRPRTRLRRRRVGGREPQPGRPVVPPVVPRVPPDVSGIADVVRDTLHPVGAVTTAAVARLPALEAHAGDGLPARLAVAPSYDDALFWDLLALSPTWILPGVDGLGRNRVRLVEVNREFVGAFLLGANTELVRELRWRGYPIDATATAFRRFWHYVADPARTDIEPVADWAVSASLAEVLAGEGGDPEHTMTAVVVRGDIVRRYPDAHWFLQQAVADGDEWGVTGAPVEVSFLGSLDGQTAVYGFDLDPEDVRGDRPSGVPGHFIGVEERPGAPRFGLDVAARGDFDETPASWDAASWGHLVGSRAELAGITHAPITTGRLADLDIDGTVWGRNAGHQAAATWQRPFRLLLHADLVI